MTGKDKAVYAAAAALLLAGLAPHPLGVVCAAAGAALLAEWRGRRRHAALRRANRALVRRLGATAAQLAELQRGQDLVQRQVQYVRENTKVTADDWGPGFGYAGTEQRKHPPPFPTR
jgi:hypothetical protein